MKNQRRVFATFALCAITLISACGAPASQYSSPSAQQVAPEPAPITSKPTVNNPADRAPMGDVKYAIPPINKNTLFSDDVSDILNAFDSNGKQEKLEICAKAAEVMSSLSEAEITQRSYAMSDYSWSTLEDLATDCNNIAEALK